MKRLAIPPTLRTRDEATALGLKRYYTGRRCSKGHDAERFTSNGGCVECVNRKLPAQHRGVQNACNVGWPKRAMVFAVNFRPTPEEIEAAFFYAEAVGWLSEALRRVHNDPALLAQYVKPLSAEEQGMLYAALERNDRVMARIRASIETVTPRTDSGEPSK